MTQRQHFHTRRNLSETGRQIHLPRKQCLIDRKRHRHTANGTAIDRLSIIWKSDLTDKMKRSFFQAAVVSILLYACTTWMLTKRLEKKLDGNYTRMLRAILNKSWRQHPTRHQLHGHLPPITKTILVRRTRHAGHCWRSRDELISDALLWTPTYGREKAGGQLEYAYSSYMRIRDVALKTCQRRWTIGRSGERGSGISVLPARHDDIWKWLIGLNSELFICSLPCQGEWVQSALLFTHNWRENNWIHNFPHDIRAVWNAKSLIKVLKSGQRVHFPTTRTIIPVV